ncbi:MAG: STAS domain-containing protein [Phycisphaerales bacterium]|nr:STAS domain-containing protein [Phycisphaerales bacterium]
MADTDTFLQIHEEGAGIVVITPTADIDMSRSPELRTAIQQAMSKKINKLIVNLDGVNYMDSSGLATLVEAMRTANTSNTQLILTAMHPKVRAIFDIARLDSFFTIIDSVEQAI